jgi:hypothetical protein
MRRLVQFLQSKWEEILVTGIWVPLVLAAVLPTEPIIALSLVGSAASLFGIYFRRHLRAALCRFSQTTPKMIEP